LKGGICGISCKLDIKLGNKLLIILGGKCMKNVSILRKCSYILTLALVLLIVMSSFAACSGGNKQEEQKSPAVASDSKDGEKGGESKAEEPKTEKKDKYVIGFSQCTLNHPWRVAMVEGNKKWIAENAPDVELIVTDGENNATNQVSDVEELIARNVDVLVISPLQAEALTAVTKRAMDKGMKVITLDRKVNTPVTLHIGAENYPIGVTAAKFLNEKLNGKGNIITIQGTAGASVVLDRQGGLVDTIKKDYPDLKIIGDQYCDFLREPAMKYMEDMLQRFGPGQIQAVYAHNDEMALGAIQALKSAGRLEEVLVVGVDGENLAFEAIKKGEMDLTVTYPYCAPEGMIYAYKLAKGEELPPEIKLENKPVDATNIDEWLGKGF